MFLWSQLSLNKDNSLTSPLSIHLPVAWEISQVSKPLWLVKTAIWIKRENSFRDTRQRTQWRDRPPAELQISPFDAGAFSHASLRNPPNRWRTKPTVYLLLVQIFTILSSLIVSKSEPILESCYKTALLSIWSKGSACYLIYLFFKHMGRT